MPTAQAQRTLAAIVPTPDGNTAWFFKAMGNRQDIQAMRPQFVSWLTTIGFDSTTGDPTWTLPEDWSSQAGNSMRFATLRASNGQEISIISLPARDPWDGYVLENVNRWRAELTLPPIDQDQLQADGQTITTPAGELVFVDLEREAFGGGFDQNDVARPAGIAEEEASSEQPIREQATEGLRFDTPETWTAGPTNAFRQAAFRIARQGQQAEVTVIGLGPFAGSLTDNVNRWRQEIDLPAQNSEQIKSAVERIDVDGIASQYIQIVPDSDESKAIIAVVVPRSHETIFVKMTGDAPLVKDQREAFRQFVTSIRF